MIFLTVGTQLPFDRLVSVVDNWAKYNKTTKVIAQIGDSSLNPQNMECSASMTAPEFKACCEASDIIVSHAGMGTILTGLDLGKQVVILPRLASLGEHRNDHQLATAKQFKHLPLIHAVFDSNQLSDVLIEALDSSFSMPKKSGASSDLLQTVRSFLTIESKIQGAQA
jgi:UDP-N-acetylglucosamine transferase subunit ALG13